MRKYEGYINSWYPSNEKESFCTTILNSINEYGARLKNPALRPRHRNHLGVLLNKYVALTYLMGTRRMELFEQPMATLAFTTQAVEITHRNLKHKSPNDVTTTLVPWCCPSGNRLWEYVTNNYTSFHIPTILATEGMYSIRDIEKPLWPSPQAISGLVKSNYKLRMTNPKTLKQSVQGLGIHQLRHWRCYHLLLQANKGLGYRPAYIQKFFNWVSPAMLYHYASIRSRLSMQEQRAILSADGSLRTREEVEGDII